MTVKHLIISDNSEKEMHQKSAYHRFSLKSF